jgi:hypothetical protein
METFVYHNNAFDSQLVAQWAIFFDVLSETCEYRKSGVILEGQAVHKPDFWLPRQEAWVLILPHLPSEAECTVAVRLFHATGKGVFLFSGFPQVMKFQDKFSSDSYVWEICNFAIHTVGQATAGRCESYLLGTLNQTMLDILNLLDDQSSYDQFRLQTLRLAEAARKAAVFFEQPSTLGDVLKGLESNFEENQ